MELIPIKLQLGFRELCVRLPLRIIDEIFSRAGLTKGNKTGIGFVSGERRGLVEEYYSSINWGNQDDITKFINAIEISLVFFEAPERERLKELCAEVGIYINNSVTLDSKKSTDGIRGSNIKNKNIFVVHGRNLALKDSLFAFLRCIDLAPLEWNTIVKATGKPSPYIGEILQKGFSMAQAILVLFSPEDEARLQERFRNEHEPEYERNLTPQARQNVIFEAGMAMGIAPDRTILVQCGSLRPFTDISGIHFVHLDNTAVKRKELVDRLVNAGCMPNTDGSDWLSSNYSFDFNS